MYRKNASLALILVLVIDKLTNFRAYPNIKLENN